MENKKNTPSPTTHVTSSNHAVDPSAITDEEKSIQSIQAVVDAQKTNLKRTYYDPIVVPGEVVEIPFVEEVEEKAAEEVDAKLTEEEKIEKHGLGVRHFHVFMAVLAITIIYILRFNMSVAIVAMTVVPPDVKPVTTPPPTVATTPAPPPPPPPPAPAPVPPGPATNGTPARVKVYVDESGHKIPIYPWTEGQKGLVLSSFFWGYPVLQLIMGNLAEKYGSQKILTVSMASAGLLTVLTPYFASYGFGLEIMCALRVLQGLSQGSFYPCVMVLLTKWFPPLERNRAMALAYSGSHVGTLIAFPLSGYLAATKYGWPAIFFVTGSFGILWALIWSYIGASSPNRHLFISKKELQYIEKTQVHLSTEEKKLPTPWARIFLSGPVWAILLSHFGHNFGYWMLLTELPNFVSSILDIQINKTGLLSVLPYACGWLTAILFSWIAHRIYQNCTGSRTLQRKVWNTLALWGGAYVLFILGTSEMKDVTVTMFLLMGTMALNSGIYNGFLTNHVDLAPNFVGTLMGLINSLAALASITGPLLVGWIVTERHSHAQWRYVFLISGSVMFATNLFYVLFGSAELQDWNTPSES